MDFSPLFYLLAWAFAVILGVVVGLIAGVVTGQWIPSLISFVVGVCIGWFAFVRRTR